MKIVKHGSLTLQGRRVVQGKWLETPLDCGLRTLQGSRAVLWQVVACNGN